MAKQTWGYTYSLFISLVQIRTCIKISIHGHIFCLTSEMWMYLIKLPPQTHWVCSVTLLKLDEFWSPEMSDPRGLGTMALLGTLLNLPLGLWCGPPAGRVTMVTTMCLSPVQRIAFPRPPVVTVLISWGCCDKGPKARRLKQQHFYYLMVWRPEVWDGGVCHQVRFSGRLSCCRVNGHLIPEFLHSHPLCVFVLTFVYYLNSSCIRPEFTLMTSLAPITSLKGLSPNTVRFWGARGQSFNMWICGNTTHPTSHHTGHCSSWCPSLGSTLTSVTFYKLHLKTHLHPGQAWGTMETGVPGLPACLPSYCGSDLPLEVWILTSRTNSHEEKL